VLSEFIIADKLKQILTFYAGDRLFSARSSFETVVEVKLQDNDKRNQASGSVVRTGPRLKVALICYHAYEYKQVQ
jgi:hypothetical protein